MSREAGDFMAQGVRTRHPLLQSVIAHGLTALSATAGGVFGSIKYLQSQIDELRSDLQAQVAQYRADDAVRNQRLVLYEAATNAIKAELLQSVGVIKSDVSYIRGKLDEQDKHKP